MTAPGEHVVAIDHMHVGPGDDLLEHRMSPFCPCHPELSVEDAQVDDGDDPCQVITYRHNYVGEAVA